MTERTMSTQPLVNITKSGVVLRPEAVNLLHAYTRYFIQHSRAKLDEYLFDLGGSLDDRIAAEAQQAICAAVDLLRELDEADDHIGRVYDRNFEMWAQVFRQTRIELGLERIEASPHLYAAVKIVMAMLRAENPKFSESKFINYINN
jgi:hypothetical protein